MDTAQINTSDDMSWSHAHGLVQSLVIKEIVALDQKAIWHDDCPEEDDYSHSEAAKMCRRDAERLRQALFILARGI